MWNVAMRFYKLTDKGEQEFDYYHEPLPTEEEALAHMREVLEKNLGEDYVLTQDGPGAYTATDKDRLVLVRVSLWEDEPLPPLWYVDVAIAKEYKGWPKNASWWSRRYTNPNALFRLLQALPELLEISPGPKIGIEEMLKRPEGEYTIQIKFALAGTEDTRKKKGR